MRVEEYAGRSAVELARLVAAGEVSAAELTALALEAAARVDPGLNAVVEIYDDAAERAAAVDAAVARTAGDGSGAPPPLAGVPFFRKDIGASEAGKRTELGSRLAEGLVTHRDSHLTTAFKDAGLVIIGRSATSEMGAYGTVESAARGTTVNPWHPERTSGGSSGGSAALVAAGVVPIAHANDGAGSIRIPASCCGLVGLKPSRGRVSAGPGAGEPNHGGSVQLVVSRTVADTAAALDAVAGPRPGDPFTIPAPPEPFAATVAAPFAMALPSPAAPTLGGAAPGERPVRIGATIDAWGPGPVDAQVAAAVIRTAEVLELVGHSVEWEQFPFDYEVFEPAFVDLWAVGVAGGIAAVGERMHRPLTEEFLEPVTLAWIEVCDRLRAVDVSHALDTVNRMARRVGTWFQRYDVLLVPTLAQLPTRFGEIDGNHPGMAAIDNARALLAVNPYCPLFNLTGQPALTLPLGQSVEGLPIGVQLVGRHAEESLLLALGAQLEQALPWADRRAPVHAAAGGPSPTGG